MIAAGLLSASLLAGCAAKSEYEFDSLDLAPPQENLSELKLGQYSIPIPVAVNREAKALVHRTAFQLDFELYALVRPEQKSTIENSWDRYEGKIRDRVIRVCRNSSVEELQDPELSALKARLMDALAEQFGKDDLRQLLITEVVSQRL